MATNKIASRSLTLLSPVLRFPIRGGQQGFATSDYPNVELRATGQQGTFCLAMAYHESSSSNTLYYDLMNSNGSVGVGAIKTSSVTVTMPAGSDHVAINAPSVANYTFVCWLGVSSSGSIRLAYIENMTAASSTIWTDGTRSSNTTYVGYALYKRGLNLP